MVEKYGQIFTRGYVPTEDSIIIGGGLYLCGNNSSNFFPGFASLTPGFQL